LTDRCRFFRAAWYRCRSHRSRDAGRHWSILTSSLSLHGIPEMDFVTASTGYILSYQAGANRTPDFLKTTNGGHTWQRITPHTS